MQIFATALLAAVAASYDVSIKEGENTQFETTFSTSYKIEGEAAAQKLTLMIENEVMMADGVENEDDIGIAYSFLCVGDKTDAKDCYEMRFEHETGKGSTIQTSSWKVPAASSKISDADAAKLTSPGPYFNAKGKAVGAKEIENSSTGWKLRSNATGNLVETMDLTTAKCDKEGGKLLLSRVAATTEEYVDAAKKVMGE